MSHTSKLDAESHVRRNPHPDFRAVEAARPPFDHARSFHFTKTPAPDWAFGSGANDGSSRSASASASAAASNGDADAATPPHIEIDPYAPDRPPVSNYKLLISAIVPRPIGFLSTRSADGSSTNLAPFSYTQVVNHDPPIFVVGFAGGYDKAKDSLRNLNATGECTINIVGEHMLEAMNACSINAPYGVSEWALSGLTPAECRNVQCSRVKESMFSVEGRLVETREWESRATPGKKTGVTAMIEGVRFWAREDALEDNKDEHGNEGPRSKLDVAVLRPISRLGGITYARVVDGIELPRPDFEESLKGWGGEEEAREKGIFANKRAGQL